MEFYFNELSLAPVDSLVRAKNLMEHFVYSCHFLRKAGFSLMRSISNGDHLINNHILFKDYHIYTWKKDDSVDEVQRNLFRDILTRCLVSPLIVENDQETASDVSNMYFEFTNGTKQTLDFHSGLSLASYKSSLLVSFSSLPIWMEPFIPVKQIIFLPEDQIKEIEEDIRNVTTPDHIDVHREWINILTVRGILPKWKPSQCYFPSTTFAATLIPDGDWNQFHLTCQGFSTEVRISTLEEIAGKVAERNGYSKNPKLSSKNGRTIFLAGKNRNRIFLALDTQHGTFEVCNFSGDHLGEYTFGGVKIDQANATHGIII